MQTKTSNAPSTQDPQQEQPDIRGEGGGVPVDAEQPFQNAAEQALRGAPAQPDEEGALYVPEKSVLRGESKKLGDATDTDIGQESSVPVDPTSQENLPFPLPREMCLHIFSFLNTQNLQRTALVNKQSYSLSTNIRQKHFQKKFANSHWWKFLVAVTDNVPGEGEKKFVDVLILGMGPNTVIPEGWRENNATLSGYVTRWMGWFPDKIQRLGFSVSGYEDIQRIAQTLLAMMCHDNDRADFNACTEIRDCFALVEDKNKIAAFQQYDDLDRLFSCMFLFEFMRGAQANNRLNFLISTPFARGLTGEGLIALECQFSGIFPELVREAIRLFQIEVRLEADQQRLKAIERLLGKLAETDILQYVDTEAEKPPFLFGIPLQRQIFIEALRSNYEFLISKMTFPILISVEHTVNDPNKLESLLLIPHIIQSHFILSRLAPRELLSLLKIIRKGQLASVINDHPILQPYCTVEIMEELLKVDVGRSKLARVFLSNKTLLDKLSDNHIVAFAEHFAYLDFEATLESEALQTRLRADPHNNLLMRLAKSNSAFGFGQEILNNLTVSSLLTAEEAIQLFNFNTINQTPLLNNKSLMDKLSSAQLIHLIKNCTNSFKYTGLVVQGRLHKFTNSDLLILVRSRVSERDPSQLSNYLLDVLPAEIDRRLSQGIGPNYQLDPAALCTLSCAHQQLACYILCHHAEKLKNNEFLLIRDHYPLRSYAPNTPIRIAIEKESQQRLEKLEKTSKVTVTNPSPAVSPPPTITPRNSTPVYHKTRKDPHEPKPTQETSLLSDDEWSWVYFIIQLLCLIGAVFGLLLAISGIGSAAGIGIVSTTTQLFFASLPMSHALVAGIMGLGIFIASSIGWLATDDAKQHALTLKNKTSEVGLSHKTNDAQLKKQHGTEFNYQNNFTSRQNINTDYKKVDSSSDGAEEEMLVDRESCLKY